MTFGAYSAWTTGMLLLVLVLIPVALWAVKRLKLLPATGSGRMRVVESLSIGPRERLLIVNVGDESLLIGSTAQRIELLREIGPTVEAQKTQGPNTPFQQVLSQARGSDSED